MSAPNFSFPPPPPPPPKAASSTYPVYGQSNYLQSNGSGGRAGRLSRGRGRGDGHRGSRGGIFRGQGNPSTFSAGPPRDGGYRPHQNTGYPHHIPTNLPTSYPLPEYPQEQQSQFRPQQNGFPQYPPLGNYSQPVAYEVAQPHTSHSYSSSVPPQPYAHGYRPPPYGFPEIPLQAPPSQPPIMGPPIRMGFDNGLSQNYHSYSNQTQGYGRPENARRSGPKPRYNDHSPSHGQRNSSLQKSNRNPSTIHVTNNRLQAPKHGTSTALQRPPNSLARPQAAPAVPSFGIPLPSKPPAPNDNAKKSRKKKRKHNQLGLTPAADVHESSEEEEDADEEAKLAAAVGAGGSEQKHLQFTYRGHTATLQNPADIAAWIEERKKRFPTKARIQEALERKCLLQEKLKAAKAAKAAFKQTQEKKRSELQERGRQEKAEEDKREKERAKSDPKDVALKARLKAEKLRRRLNKEEKKVAKAEAEAEEARVRAEATQNGACFPQSVVAGNKRKRGEVDGVDKSVNCISTAAAVVVKHELPNGEADEEPDTEATTNTEQSPIQVHGHAVSLEEMIAAASTNVCEPEAMESHPLMANPDSAPEPREVSGIVYKKLNVELSPLEDITKTDSESDDTMSISSSSPEPSSNDDNTSSSGSSSEDDAPDETPSKRDGPMRVPPPKREKPKSLCTQFLKTGYCKRGNKCHFLHELPERGSSRAGLAHGKKPVTKNRKESKPKRKSLYERLVEQEKEKEDEQVLRAIIQLGQSGVLDPPPTVSEPATAQAENGAKALC